MTSLPACLFQRLKVPYVSFAEFLNKKTSRCLIGHIGAKMIFGVNLWHVY